MQSIPAELRGMNVLLSVSPYVTVLFFMFAVYVVSLSCSCRTVLLFQSVCQSPYRIAAAAAVASVGVACPLLAACNCQLERLICLRMQLLWGPWSVNGQC